MVAKRCGGEIVESKTTKSTYLKISGKTIRLSDHATVHQSNASGFISIIVPKNNSDMFVLMTNGDTSSSVSIVDYKRVRELVNTFSDIPLAFGQQVVKEYTVEKVEKPTNAKKEDTIFGVPKTMFNENQLRIFRQTAKKVAAENNLSVPNL
jgi:hypothetical protein